MAYCRRIDVFSSDETMRYYLLDRITRLEPPERAEGIKCVSLSDPIFEHHFPGHPIMPGALIIEGLAQLGGVLLEATMREQDRHDLHAVLTIIDRAKFRRVVRPGDRLEMKAEGLRASEDGGQVDVKAYLDGELATEAKLTFAFAEVTDERLVQKRRDVLNTWLHGSIEEPTE